MALPHHKRPHRSGKGLFTGTVWALLPLRILMDQAPVTLNPRMALDASGQRINALVFRGLTRIDANLNPQPDLASGWETRDSGRIWEFRVRPGLKDHSGQPITPQKIAACLESYHHGKPFSPLSAAFPFWVSTESTEKSVILKLKNPDPYLARNISLLRYFTTAGEKEPCLNPKPEQAVIGSGNFKPLVWNPAPEGEMTLVSVEPSLGLRPLRLLFVEDDNMKALKLLHGEVDAIQSAISLTKTHWIQQTQSDHFTVLTREGVGVSYLAFNLRDPILAKKNVRIAIAEAIDREGIARDKFFGFASVAGGLLSPLLPENYQAHYDYNPRHSEKLLDEAGFSRGPDGIRLHLHYKTTPVREGVENALIFQDQLKKIGIDLIIDVVEPAVFFASIRKGACQLYSSRWLGVADGSILYRTLRTAQLSNRGQYHNPEVDRLLDQAIVELDLSKRAALLRKAQEIASKDLPFFPLWYWKNALILRKGIDGITADQLSLSGALEPLTHLTELK